MVGQSSKDNVSAKYSIFLSVNSISTSPFVFECGKIKAHNSRQGGETFTLVRILMKKISCNNNFTCSYIYFKLTCTADSHVSPSQGLALETFVHNGNFVQNPFFSNGRQNLFMWDFNNFVCFDNTYCFPSISITIPASYIFRLDRPHGLARPFPVILYVV